jgi:DUF4097 and DUF4098 domain-containing protein YvlB
MMQRVLRILIVLLAAGVSVPRGAAAQVYPERLRIDMTHVAAAYQRRDRDEREEQTERTTRTVRLGSSGELTVGNVAGDITISRGGGSDATIDIVKVARARSADEAKELLGLVTVDVTERNGRAEVRTRYPSGDENRRNNRRNFNVTVSYTITAPAGTRITANSVSGNVRVSDIKGELSAGTISGDVRIASAGAIAGAKTVSGNVEIVDAQADQGLEASSVSGDVTLRRVKARRIDAGSVSGNVKLEDVQCERAEAHSTSGNIEFSGPLAARGRYELKSFSGEVHLTVAGSTGFEVEATTFSGDVRSDLPITMRGNTDPNERRRRRSLNGTYGDGSAVLELSTFSGSIVIAKK